MAEELVQRRLAAIFAADVVGYSRLMGIDEAGTRARFNAHFNDLIVPAVSNRQGRIVKTLGDGLLVEFPSVVDAVQCAIEIQKEMAVRNANEPDETRIEFRIGINLGDIIVEGNDLHGDGVNVAARLEGLADAGGICISRAARDQIRDKLGYGLEDMGEIEVKNIARPVRAFRVLRDGSTANTSKPSFLRRHSQSLAIVSVAVLALCGGIWWWKPWIERVEAARPERFAHVLPDKPSIVILPFKNLSSDPEQEYFVDGFTEDLITNVAQSKELFVIAGNSTFAYKGRAVRIQEVAEELGVRYVLEGSVRRIGDSMRITAQLIDAANGTNVWAKQYDKPTNELFDIQDTLSHEISGTLLSSIRSTILAQASKKRPLNLSAYEFVLQARAKWDLPNKAAKLEARALAERAIALDPSFAPAYAVLGDTYNSAYIFQWEGAEALDRAYEAAHKAIELDPQSSIAHELLGRVLLRRVQHDDAIAAIERAISINPNRSSHYASLADVLTFANRPDEAIALMKTAMRRDPFYPHRYNMYLGRAYYFAKRYEMAVDELVTCETRAPKYRPCYMYLAPSYAELGKQADAKRTVAALLTLAPGFSIGQSVENHLPFVQPAMAYYVSGLRKAGVPE